ncbi:MAG: hypothetical protein F4X25_13295 [Chloroflexi bacterium]|nr:hypothetical protein [Chloroflexota bacterium]
MLGEPTTLMGVHIMFDTFADWAAIPILIELGVVALFAASGSISRAFHRWVDWRTFRSAAKLDVLAHVLGKHPADQFAGPGNIIEFTAIFFSKAGHPMLRKHLSDVTFTPIGDLGLEPLGSVTVTPRGGYARCRFVVTKDGQRASAIAHSGAVYARVELKGKQPDSSPPA